MAKASTPIRVQDELLRAAAVQGGIAHRSAAQQLEYWAEIGRTLSALLPPDTLVKVRTGLARVQIEPMTGTPLDVDEVFADVAAKRKSGELAATVHPKGVRYQASTAHPGLLEQIQPSGERVTGQFVDGKFVAGAVH